MKIRRFLVCTLATVLVLGIAETAEALITPVRVLGGPADQIGPIANGTWLGWSQSAKGKNHYDAFVRRLSGTAITRVNAAGTEGFFGGFVPGTRRVLFQQAGGAASNLYTFNLNDHVRKPVAAVNTDLWEWGPRVSASFILFVRTNFNQGVDRLLLFNRTTGKTRLLFTIKNIVRKRIYTGSVGDRYASWSACGAGCAAYVFDSKTGRAKQVPSIGGKPVYATAVNEDEGALYYVRSGFGCGVNVAIWKRGIHLFNPPVKVAALHDGIDADGLSLARNANTGDTDAYFARFNCAAGDDLYAVRGVSNVPL